MNLRWALGPLPASPIVAVVGAGGKTSLIHRLATELSVESEPVVITTTTHILPPSGPDSRLVLGASSEKRWLGWMEALAARTPRVIVIAGATTPEGKLAGIPPEEVERYRIGTAGVLVEADGARGLILKAPAEHEPVIPAATDLVIVVGSLRAVGRPLDGAAIHRPERVTALTGIRSGESVTAQAVAGLLTHPKGGLKGVPAQARVAAYLNRVDDVDTLRTGREIARLALRPRGLSMVALGSAQAPDPVVEVHSRVGAVVLAAGAARRFGRLKQTLPWGESTLVGRTVNSALASQIAHVVVVTGFAAGQVEAALDGRPVAFVRNERWADGQSSSVRAGLAALPADVEAAVFLLADQPRVSPTLIDAVIQRHRETRAPIVVPAFEGRRGNPALFDRRLFPELATLTGDMGGRPLFARHAAEVVEVEWPEPLWDDVDTPEDYEQLRAREDV